MICELLQYSVETNSSNCSRVLILLSNVECNIMEDVEARTVLSIGAGVRSIGDQNSQV